jgi:hypothetical protein
LDHTKPIDQSLLKQKLLPKRALLIVNHSCHEEKNAIYLDGAQLSRLDAGGEKVGCAAGIIFRQNESVLRVSKHRNHDDAIFLYLESTE